MIEIQYSKKFKKNFCKRVPEGSTLDQKYNERLNIFITDLKNKIIKDHKLTGNLKNYRAFSISGDVRVIYYQLSEEKVLFIDIGTHNQIYD